MKNMFGRNAEKVAALAREYGIERFTTDFDALKNPGDCCLSRSFSASPTGRACCTIPTSPPRA